MRRVVRKVGVSIFDWSELTSSHQNLFWKAINVRPNAQAPYSHYKVGCAVLVESGEIFTGVNVERNSWTQTTHAEQNAIDNAISRLGSMRLSKIVVVGAPEDEDIPIQPPRDQSGRIEKVVQVCPSCGHCLQIILENCYTEDGSYNPDVELLGAHNGEFYITTVGEAMPMPFLPQYLGTNYVKIMEEARKRPTAQV